MKFFISMLKSKNTARKATTIAVITTAVLLLAATIALIVSSVVFATRDGRDDQRDNDETPPPAIEYMTIDKIDNEQLSLGESVKVKENRTPHPAGATNQYYASYNVSVLETVQKHLDAMLIANYNANKSSMVSDTSDNANCNIPVVKSSANGGLNVTILTYDDENNKPYVTTWLTNNAARYGFVQNGSTFIYVGVPHAAYMVKYGLTSIADYVQAMSNGSVKITASDALASTSASYEIYHIASGAELTVPSNFAYTATSDGNGGYIIAVNLSRPISSAAQ